MDVFIGIDGVSIEDESVIAIDDISKGSSNLKLILSVK